MEEAFLDALILSYQESRYHNITQNGSASSLDLNFTKALTKLVRMPSQSNNN